MAFLEFVEEGLNTVGTGVSRFAKETKDTARLHAAVVSANSKMTEQYEKIGRLIYDAYKGDAVMLEEFGDTIKEAFTIIENEEGKKREAQDTLVQNKGGIQCPDCGTTLPKGSSFCSKCGKSL